MVGLVLVISRFRSDDVGFAEQLLAAAAVLAEQRGFVAARTGRNLDEPQLWSLVTEWADVGSYRRALSSYDVKVGAVPVLSVAIDEPSAYESLEFPLNDQVPRVT